MTTVSTQFYSAPSANPVQYNTASFFCRCIHLEVKFNQKGEKYAVLGFETQPKAGVPKMHIHTSCSADTALYSWCKNKRIKLGKEVVLTGHITDCESYEETEDGLVKLENKIIKMSSVVAQAIG